MISIRESSVLRSLAKQVADIAALPIQEERRELWKKHNSLKPTHPMILVFPEGAWQELLPEKGLACEGEEARGIERALLERIYYYQHFQDDTVIEKEWIVRKVIRNCGWGLQAIDLKKMIWTRLDETGEMRYPVWWRSSLCQQTGGISPWTSVYALRRKWSRC